MVQHRNRHKKIYIVIYVLKLCILGDAAPIIMEGLTNWKEDFEIMRKDSRRFDGCVKNKSACEFNKLKHAATDSLPLIDYPMLILHEICDNVTLPSSSELVYKTIKTKDEQKQLHLIPKLKHEVFFDFYYHLNYMFI